MSDSGSASLLGRRAVLRGSALAITGLGAAVLIGCGKDDGSGDTAAGGTTAGPGATVIADDPRYPRDPELPYPFNYPEPDKEPKPGGTLRVAATWDVSTMDPTKSAAGGTIVVPNLVYNRLIGIKGGPEANPFKIETEPELADSWEFSPDGLTATFKLRPDIKWQNIPPLDGRAFVADDVVYALTRYSQEGVHQSYYENVERIEAVDDTTVKFTLKKPTPEFEVPFGTRYQTIFPRELVESGEIERRVIGTGPMILQEATPGQRVVLAKNPEYWRKQVLLDGAEFRIMPDSSARVAAFRAGQIDYAYSIAASKRELDDLVRSMPDLQVNIPAAVNTVLAFAMNLSNPKFQDVRVRRALSLAIDRKMITALLYDNLGEELVHVLPWTYMFDQAPTDLGPWVKYDVAEAKKQLQAAGAENFTFDYMYYPYTTAYERQSEILVDQFRSIGVNMRGGKVDYTEFNSQWVNGRIPEATTSGWAPLGFDANTFFYNQIYSESPGNRWQLKDAEIDDYAVRQSTELDPEVRKELHRKIWDRELDQMFRPPLPLGYAYEPLPPYLRGIRFGSILGSNSSYYEWGMQIENVWLDK